MERSQFARFADALRRLGAGGVGAPEFVLGRERNFELQYIPFEHVNRRARLILVGITPGNNQLALAYERAQTLLLSGRAEHEILAEVKKAAAFGGPAMRPNLLKMLRHFRFDRLLGISDVEALWGENADLLHSTSVVPHATFKSGKMFAGSFKEVMSSPLLAECFLDCFVPATLEMSPDALFVGLGSCPEAALEWCVEKGVLARRQVLGAFCHPSTSGGSTTRYYLRQVTREELDPKNPVLKRCDWLDRAYEQMSSATGALLGDVASDALTPSPRIARFAPPALTPQPSPSAPRMRMREHSTAATRSGGAAHLISEVQKAGYKLTRENTKLAEFESPGGEVIYLIKTSSSNTIRLMVHPRLEHEAVRRLDGVESVSSEHRFHSNMARFPKRLNHGQTETAYGWQVHLDSAGSLGRFLTAFERTPPVE